VRYRPGDRCANQQSIHQVIKEELEQINMQMSTYREDSEVLRFNRSESPEEFKRSIAIMAGLSDAALATSGDYRNFFVDSDSRFSHTINPKTGRPVTHSLASNSVVANNAALADAIATCMMVLGKSDGLRLAEENN